MRAEDREYVERALAGEPGAFEELVRKYHRLGGAIAFGVLGDFHLAEDVVQESFLKVFRALESLRDPRKFRVWFAGVVRKQAIDVLRQRRSAVVRASSLDAGGASGERGDLSPDAAAVGEGLASDARRTESAAAEGALDRVVRLEERRKILECIAELPEEDRTVVVLKHMEGLSYREIAEVTGATVAAVESRLFRARQTLRRKLSRLLKTDSPGR
jgi:RNA polymerase sigma-70 factor (ECF subfamily)